MAYLPLSTANLPDPVIDPAQGASPEDHFNTVIWTGNGTSGRSITTGHQPDFVWTKERNSAINHIAQNSISGTGLYLHPNTTAAEQSATTLITSFDSDGFTIGNSGSINGSSDTYVAWSWKANGSGVSNTDGSITSTVSANTTSGFSIGTFVGNQTAGATVGHGLSQAPEMIIIKDRPTVNDWPVYHASISPSQTIKLNSANAAFTESTIWNNTAPTASVFTLGSSNLANNNTKSHVFYAFHSVDGFSKFGSYQGGSDPFVYLGFEPAMIIFKRADGTATHWAIRDNTRYTYNPNRYTLYPSKPDAEYTGTLHDIDFLSNGFKIRNGDGLFDASAKYIYAAWAKAPFKYGTGV